MAARRLASTTNWASLGARMPGGKSREVYAAAKISAETQMAKIVSSPAALPPIDWAMYSRLLPGVQMVDDFRAKYEAITVDYPVDAGNKLAVAAAADASVKAIAAEVVREVESKCAGSKKDIAFFEKLPAARSMTYEMYLELFPNASSVVPKEREQLEGELADVTAALDAHKAKKA
jgi:hypothetical protein